MDEEHEKLLRKLAKEKYSSKKGSISEVVKEALEGLAKAVKREVRSMNRVLIDTSMLVYMFDISEEKSILVP